MHGKTDAIKFIAAYTRTRASAEDFCREKNIPLLDRFEDALADPNIDAVVLATPHSRHAEQVMAAAAAGKHVHVEKPLTLDRPSAEAAVAAAKRAGIVLAVGFNRRFHPSVVEIRKRLASGQLGQVMSMVGTHTTSTGQFIPADNWRAQPDEAPGGAITAVGVHSIDHMIEFAGPVRDVLVTTGPLHRRAFRRHHQHHAALQERRDGVAVLLGRDRDDVELHACSAPRAWRNSPSRIWRASASCRSRRWRRPDRSPRRRTRSSKARRSTRSTPNWSNSARCIEEKRPYPVAIDQVLHGMAVFDAVVRSGKSGQIEKVE